MAQELRLLPRMGYKRNMYTLKAWKIQMPGAVERVCMVLRDNGVPAISGCSICPGNSSSDEHLLSRCHYDVVTEKWQKTQCAPTSFGSSGYCQ